MYKHDLIRWRFLQRKAVKEAKENRTYLSFYSSSTSVVISWLNILFTSHSLTSFSSPPPAGFHHKFKKINISSATSQRSQRRSVGEKEEAGLPR